MIEIAIEMNDTNERNERNDNPQRDASKSNSFHSLSLSAHSEPLESEMWKVKCEDNWKVKSERLSMRQIMASHLHDSDKIHVSVSERLLPPIETSLSLSPSQARWCPPPRPFPHLNAALGWEQTRIPLDPSQAMWHVWCPLWGNVHFVHVDHFIHFTFVLRRGIHVRMSFA